MDALTDILALALAGVHDDAACAMLAKSIAALCGSPSFHLQRHTASDAVFVSTHNLNADTHRDYVDHYWRHDLWANRFPVSLGPQVRDSESFISKDEWERSEIYNDLLRPNGDVYRCAGFVAPLDAASTLVAGAHRTRRQPAFAQEDLDRLQAIMPVLSHLVTARRRLEEGQPDLAARLLDVGPDPALALDADGAVRHQNRAAETAFLTGGPLARRGDGVAVARAEQDGRAFARAVRLACEGRGGSRLYLRDAQARVHAVHLDGLPSLQGLAAVRWLDKAKRLREDLDAAIANLGLTAAEGALAEAMLSGISAGDYAERRGVSITTVRSQIRTLFAKAGVTRQAELVAALRSGAAPAKR